MTEFKSPHRPFTIIKGGRRPVSDDKHRTFVSSYITDTRLMGVVGLYIHWRIQHTNSNTSYHQFFYLDAEEFGFETYKGVPSDDPEEVTMVERSIIGGLGGMKSDLTEKEARWVLQQFAEMNRRLGLPMPDPTSEYQFLLKDPISLSPREMLVMVDKMCTPILSSEQLIHYFLMRMFGKDADGVSYLAEEDALAQIREDDFSEHVPAALCRNSIEEHWEKELHSYLCESLIEFEGKYKVVTSEITVHHSRVTSAKKVSSFLITHTEAAMLLNRPEFISVYEVACGPEEFDRVFLPMMVGSMETSHDNGRLFMEFNVSNDHVNKKIFRLNEDIHGLFYVSDYGQLIVTAYTLNKIHQLELFLKRSQLNQNLIPVGKFEFKEPILYEFIQSDFDDFLEFVETNQT